MDTRYLEHNSKRTLIYSTPVEILIFFESTVWWVGLQLLPHHSVPFMLLLFNERHLKPEINILSLNWNMGRGSWTQVSMITRNTNWSFSRLKTWVKDLNMNSWAYLFIDLWEPCKPNPLSMSCHGCDTNRNVRRIVKRQKIIWKLRRQPKSQKWLRLPLPAVSQHSWRSQTGRNLERSVYICVVSTKQNWQINRKWCCCWDEKD